MDANTRIAIEGTYGGPPLPGDGSALLDVMLFTYDGFDVVLELATPSEVAAIHKRAGADTRLRAVGFWREEGRSVLCQSVTIKYTGKRELSPDS